MALSPQGPPEAARCRRGAARRLVRGGADAGHPQRHHGAPGATVLATFALGTAAGDLTATTLGLGYLASGVLFAVAITVPAPAQRYLRLGPVLAFWAAYVLTRPLGASFADWIAVPAARGGLDLGTGPITLVLLAAIVAAVAVLAARAARAPA